MQNVLGMSSTAAGFAVLPGAILMGVAAPFIGRIYDAKGTQVLLTGWMPRPPALPARTWRSSFRRSSRSRCWWARSSSRSRPTPPGHRPASVTDRVPRRERRRAALPGRLFTSRGSVGAAAPAAAARRTLVDDLDEVLVVGDDRLKGRRGEIRGGHARHVTPGNRGSGRGQPPSAHRRTRHTVGA